MLAAIRADAALAHPPAAGLTASHADHQFAQESAMPADSYLTAALVRELFAKPVRAFDRCCFAIVKQPYVSAPASTAGSVKKNVLPSPGADSTQMRPPWRSTIRRQVASPIPVPANSDGLCRR